MNTIEKAYDCVAGGYSVWDCPPLKKSEPTVPEPNAPAPVADAPTPESNVPAPAQEKS